MEKILKREPLHGVLPDGTEITVPVRISRKCKRLILRSVDDSFEVVVPPGIPEGVVDSFFCSHLGWIARIIEKKRQYQARHPHKEKILPEEIFLPYTGERFRIIYRPADVCWTGVRTDGELLTVSGQVGSFEQCAAALRKWLIRHAESTLLVSAQEIAENHGFSGLSRLRSGIQKRSWGSCSRKGVVTLNATLLMFTKSLSEYVILHEFTHLSELNHSSRFWTKLESVYPGAKDAREALKSASELLPAWVQL